MITDMYHGANRYAMLEVENCTLDDANDQCAHPLITKNVSELPPDTKYYVRTVGLARSTVLLVQLEDPLSRSVFATKALLDCGATADSFADTEWVRLQRLTTCWLPRPIPVYNVDGTLNDGGSISEEVDLILRFDNHVERITFAVCSLGKTQLILGHTWLAYHNPEVDWCSGSVKMTCCPPGCGLRVHKGSNPKLSQTISTAPPTARTAGTSLTCATVSPTLDDAPSEASVMCDNVTHNTLADGPKGSTSTK